jgi:hypothetical protein
MRIHPISLALRFLNGKKTMRAAPFRGGTLFENDQAAVETLKQFTGQDFGLDAQKWGEWLRKNRRVYFG